MGHTYCVHFMEELNAWALTKSVQRFVRDTAGLEMSLKYVDGPNRIPCHSVLCSAYLDVGPGLEAVLLQGLRSCAGAAAHPGINHRHLAGA
jgi:hypothetical protein